jgi:DNA-binding phage protein
MTGSTTVPCRTEDHLETVDDLAACLQAVFENGSPELVAHAVGAVARSKAMAGRRRQDLYKAPS